MLAVRVCGTGAARLPPRNNGFRFACFLINFLVLREESPDYGTLLLL